MNGNMEARKELCRALKLEPFNQRAMVELMKLGLQYFKNKQFEEAIEHYDIVIELDQSNPTIFCKRAMCYLELKQYNKAKIDCDCAIRLDPYYVDAFCQRAKAYLGMNMKMAARTDLRWVLQQLKPMNQWTTEELEKFKSENVSSNTHPPASSSKQDENKLQDQCAVDKKEKALDNTVAQSSSKLIDRFYDYLVVIDFECTCEAGNNSTYKHEIIEFPAVIICTKTLKVLDSDEFKFHSYCKPLKNSKLSNFCTELTGITQDQVDSAPLFPDVLKKFMEFLEKHELGTNKTFAFVTDGEADFGTFLRVQCDLCKIPVPSQMEHWIDIRRSYCRAYKSQRTWLSKMLHGLGMGFEGRKHCGVDDAKNIARVAIRLLEDGHGLWINERLLTRKVVDGIKKGNKSLEAGKFEDAIKHYDIVIEMDQSNPTIFCKRAMAHLELEEYDKAITDCDNATSLDPDYLNAFFYRTKAHLEMKNTMAARTDLERVQQQLDLMYQWAMEEFDKLPSWTVKGANGETDLTILGGANLDTYCPGWKENNSYLIPHVPEYTNPDVMRGVGDQSKVVGEDAEHVVRRAISQIIDEEIIRNKIVRAPFVAIHSLDIGCPTHQNYGNKQMLDDVFPLKGHDWPDIEFDYLIVGPKVGVVIIETKASKDRFVGQLEKREKLLRLIIKQLNLNIPSIRKVICAPGLSQGQKAYAERNNIKVLESNIQSELQQYFMEEGMGISQDEYESLTKTLVAISSMKGDGQTGEITLRLEDISIVDAIKMESNRLNGQNPLESNRLKSRTRDPASENHPDSRLIRILGKTRTEINEDLMKRQVNVRLSDDQMELVEAFKELGIKNLTQSQLDVVMKYPGSKQLLIDGAYGTGKTKILMAMALALIKKQEHVLVFVPMSLKADYMKVFKTCDDYFKLTEWLIFLECNHGEIDHHNRHIFLDEGNYLLIKSQYKEDSSEWFKELFSRCKSKDRFFWMVCQNGGESPRCPNEELLTLFPSQVKLIDHMRSGEEVVRGFNEILGIHPQELRSAHKVQGITPSFYKRANFNTLDEAFSGLLEGLGKLLRRWPVGELPESRFIGIVCTGFDFYEKVQEVIDVVEKEHPEWTVTKDPTRPAEFGYTYFWSLGVLDSNTPLPDVQIHVGVICLEEVHSLEFPSVISLCLFPERKDGMEVQMECYLAASRARVSFWEFLYEYDDAGWLLNLKN